MPHVARQLFGDSQALHFHDVVLTANDDIQSHREKIARIVLDEMYQFVGLLDAEGSVLEINRPALDGAGVRLDEIRGRPFWDARWWAVSEETQTLQRDCVRRAGKGEFVRCDFEIYGQNRGQDKIIIDFSLAPVRDDHGTVRFLLAEGRNISDKKRAEAEIARKNEELRRLLEDLRQLDRLKNDFFANVSHELRTPLALILGPAESLLTSNNLTEEQRRDVGVIQRNSKTLLRHVNNLLEAAKLDAKQHTMLYSVVDLAAQVRTMAAHFDSLAVQRRISYQITTPDHQEAEVDRDKFDRIVLNLLSNAFKFTPEGGRIECMLSVDRQGHLLLEVRDSGPGVRPELREVIFERFRQAQGGMTRDFGGTGLGLAIAKEFVQLHGGTISVTDAPGGGAAFLIELLRQAPVGETVHCDERLPRNEERSVDVVEAIVTDTGETLEGEKPPKLPLVLVSEDNADMRRLIIGILSGEYRIVVAADGAEALAKAIAEPPDLIVTDLMMPGLGGDRLVEEVRARPALKGVPVLLLSAIADEDLRLKLLGESVQDYLIKPFSSYELRVRARNLVVMKRTRDALQKDLENQSVDLSHLTEQLKANRLILRQNLDALRASEERWRTVFENSAVGIALTDGESNFEAANLAYQKMVGFSEDELRKLSILDITHEEDREGSQRDYTELREGNEKVRRSETRYRCKNGEVIWGNLYLSLLPGKENAPPCVVAITEEITQRKRAEERLREYEQVVESAQEMIVVIDRNYRYVMANRAFLTYRGLQREEVVGHWVPDLLPQELFETVTKVKLEQALQGNVVKFELRYAYPGRSERDVAASYFPVEGPTGIDRVACILQDITERKEAERALHKLSGKLLGLEDAERRRLARELHDTTAQLLAALSMNLAVVTASADALSPKAQAAVVESATLADQCLKEIRTVSYLLHPPELDEWGLESALFRYIDGFIQRSGIEVEVEVSPGLGRMPQSVETAIFRVLQECLTNIHRHADSASARVRLIRGRTNLVLEVADKGQGIRADAPLGIGIASMRERVEQLNGRLEIASNPGGTTVKATVPLSKVAM